MATPELGTSFNDGVQNLIDRVRCRRLVAEHDRLEAYRLRYAAYLREGAIAPNETGMITDRHDHAPGSEVYGLYIDDALAATIRLSHGTPEQTDVPAMATFPDVLEPIFQSGRTLIDPTRFVLDEAHARAYPKLAYVTLRVAWLVSDHLVVDHTLASVRTEHQAFYRRFFGHTLLAPARPYPSLIKPLSLMLLPCRESRERGLQRYPFLASTREEFEALWPTQGARPESSARAGQSFPSSGIDVPASSRGHALAQAPISLG